MAVGRSGRGGAGRGAAAPAARSSRPGQAPDPVTLSQTKTLQLSRLGAQAAAGSARPPYPLACGRGKGGRGAVGRPAQQDVGQLQGVQGALQGVGYVVDEVGLGVLGGPHEVGVLPQGRQEQLEPALQPRAEGEGRGRPGCVAWVGGWVATRGDAGSRASDALVPHTGGGVLLTEWQRGQGHSRSGSTKGSGALTLWKYKGGREMPLKRVMVATWLPSGGDCLCTALTSCSGAAAGQHGRG